MMYGEPCVQVYIAKYSRHLLRNVLAIASDIKVMSLYEMVAHEQPLPGSPKWQVLDHWIQVAGFTVHNNYGIANIHGD